jgi:hypothetical protein
MSGKDRAWRPWFKPSMAFEGFAKHNEKKWHEEKKLR